MQAPPLETLTLAGGCFWCVEAVFLRVRGVYEVESGYCNGHLPNPNYEQVCSGASGHAEAVRLRFDPEQVSLAQLLAVFWVIHDPTSLNRQGADVGTQYRSGIYTHGEAQHAQVLALVQQAQAEFGGRIVTEVQPERGYCAAEEYHQRYFDRHPEAGYCSFVVGPKVEKFQRQFKALLRD